MQPKFDKKGTILEQQEQNHTPTIASDSTSFIKAQEESTSKESLQKEFEATGYASWINSDTYPNGRIYTNEYVNWLEKQLTMYRQSF